MVPSGNASKVGPGFKQTEFGVVPEDWDVRKLGELGSVVRGASPRPAGDPRFFNGSHTPWLTVAALTNIPDFQIEVVETFGFLTEEGARHSRMLKSGTLIIANSGATLGVAKILMLECCANDGIAAIVDQHLGDKRYLCYFINTRTNYLRKVVASGNGQPNLNTSLIREIHVPYPPPIEQRVIATALSEVDALIAGLDKLIVKKHAVKTATMQQLLTGKRRLPGFSGEWVVKRLREVGEVAGAGVDKKARTGEVPVRLLNYLDVYAKDFIYSSDLSHTVTAPSAQAERCAVREGDVFFTPSSEVRDDVGHSTVAMENISGATYSYHVVRLRLHDDWDLLFRAYAFKSKEFYDQAQVLCQGSGTRYVIPLKQFGEMTVRVPPISEQTAIAAVLSDMDAEIAVLTARREKTRYLKQGMMQELLVGRTRLV
jgi:type I restriction enzyme S subunit